MKKHEDSLQACNTDLQAITAKKRFLMQKEEFHEIYLYSEQQA